MNKSKGEWWCLQSTPSGTIWPHMGLTRTEEQLIEHLLKDSVVDWSDYLSKGYRCVKVKIEEV